GHERHLLQFDPAGGLSASSGVARRHLRPRRGRQQGGRLVPRGGRGGPTLDRGDRGQPRPAPRPTPRANAGCPPRRPPHPPAAPPISLPACGRGIDVNNDGQIAQPEGHRALGPREILWDRDSKIQTVADLMQLVRVIDTGIDVDGDGVPDLDSSRIYFLGRSLGGNIGAVFLSVEPSVRAGVLVSAGGPTIDGFRLRPAFRASTVRAGLAAPLPPPINSSAIVFNET